MSNAALMPIATAVWLVENTTHFQTNCNFVNYMKLKSKGFSMERLLKELKHNP